MKSIYVTDNLLAARYNVCRQTIWRWAQQGKFPAPIVLSPGCTRWHLPTVEQWEAEQNQKATA